MRRNGISQVPVADANGVIVGSIQEVTAMQLVFDHVDIAQKLVGEVMGSPYPKMDKHTEIEKGFKALSLGAPAILVRENDRSVGLLTKSDFIAYLSGDMADPESAA
ncbi:MAG: hypothetical protein IT419_10590 [Planctomycetes bacterium]|nr:hypothetical protein [Planctomycetota bacterium]